MLKNHYGASELHAVWDILMYTEHNSIARPISEDFWSTFSKNTATFTNKGKKAVKNPSDYENINILNWSDESYKIAITKYDGIVAGEDQTVPQWYQDENLQLCYERITLGGYRLAHLMEYIFSNEKEAFFLQE